MISRRTLLKGAAVLPLTPVTGFASNRINLVNIGDHGSGGNPGTRAVADLVLGDLRPELVFTNGDNAGGLHLGLTYEDSNWMYRSYIDAGLFLPTPGNHDTDVDGGDLYRQYFKVPRYYARTAGDVLLVSVDSTNLDSAQKAWAQQTLQNSRSPWKFVFTHYAPYCSGGHGSHPHTQLPWHAWGADAVFAGHNHVYERLERGSDIYFVNGLGGRSRYQFDTPLPSSVTRYRDDYGCIHITGNRTSLTIQFISQSGRLIDTREISKPVNMVPVFQSLDLL